MLTLFTYENQRPNRTVLEKFVFKGRKYTYLTATKALAVKRVEDGVIPDEQLLNDEKGNSRKLALFAEVIRAWTKREFDLSSRGEEKTMLFRAMNEVSKGDPKLRDLLRHDFPSWIRILYDLAGQGIDLRSVNLPADKRNQLVNPVIETHLKDIQSSFYNMLDREGKKVYEAAARDYLSTSPVPFDLVVMEGFTFLTDLQKWFIKQCDESGKEVVFLVPYREQQQKAYRIITETYQFVGKNRFKLDTPLLSDQEDIAHIQKYLLQTGEPVRYPAPTANVILRQYANRDRELQGCLGELKEWFESGLYEPKDVAIVMRRSKEFIDRLRDYMAMKPLQYIDKASGQKKNVELATNPRLLLLTPMGRFILTLYQIWQDNKLYLESNELESIISSGWLGATVQDSTPTFRAVKYQYFTTCRTKDDWVNVLNQLKHDCEEETIFRVPVKLADAEIIRKWIEVIHLLDSVCSRLFRLGEKSVARHIQILQEELNKMLPKDLRKAERQVLEHIQSVFKDLSNFYSIPITTEEFGDAIHALTRGQSEEEEDDDQEIDDANPAQLRIVTPETLDGMLYKAVIYVGCDNVHAPVLYPEPWPFYTDGREQHLAKERYMFLTVVRASTGKLVLSYSQRDSDRSFQPSTYMQEIKKLLGTKMVTQGILDTLDLERSHDGVKDVKVRSAKRKEYGLNELAQYGLCPLRYRLELLHPEARMYRSEWQLEIYAQGIWLHYIYGLMEQKNGTPLRRRRDEFFQDLLGFMEETREGIKKMFPAFSPVTWHAIELQVKGQLKKFRDLRYKYFRKIFKGSKESLRVMLDNDHEERTIKINLNIPFMAGTARFDVAILGDIQTGEWLLPGEAEEKEKSRDKEEGEIELDGVRLFRTQYQAVSWWRNSIHAFFVVEKEQKAVDNWYTNMLEMHYASMPEKINHLIKSIEQNKFPKHAGEHCTSCPVRLECLGIVDEEGEVTS
ncbi:hypothetical protein EDM56_02115 [Brevibacillus fluminis]|uniref:PD-(D/E)XK endonuclease-like domain-containing protein n=1 Tax=Brevibacillus fluminis TaxID=511487 RepID=A0A3M8DWP3_9BACL|nr:hypothetical protein [Brevibacillus fluminis]RNB92512.1 hypothetical protein EDM56_02115 [Brevibacillus fluminis]